MDYLKERQKGTEARIQEVRTLLANAEGVLSNKACVYLTGSFGRLEAGKESDLDLFILSKTVEKEVGGTSVPVSQLSQLDTILVKADLIKSVRKLGMPEFDSDGRYLASHTEHDLVASLGAPDDDYKNTLTGRLLLFLESRPLLGAAVHKEAIANVVSAYFRDYPSHSENFMPSFLANDILRLWRTFCVNYEFGRRDNDAAGKIKNYKLKHSRMLTCYSALLYLLGVFRLEGTVSIDRAKEMAALTPIERLKWIGEENEFADAHQKIIRIYEKYEEFLRKTDVPKEELYVQFQAHTKDWSEKSYEFGDLLSEVLNIIGGGTRFHRLILV